jgi:hypothetical protein
MTENNQQRNQIQREFRQREQREFQINQRTNQMIQEARQLREQLEQLRLQRNQRTNQETNEEQNLQKLRQTIVPLIKNDIIDFLSERIDESEKNIKSLKDNTIETLAKEGYTKEQNDERIKNLKSIKSKLETQKRTENFTYETITAVFFPMIRDRNVFMYNSIDVIIQQYLSEHNTPAIQQVQEQVELNEPVGIVKNTSLKPPSGDCPICMEPLNSTQRLCTFPCNHWAHCKCLGGISSIAIGMKCPVCRKPGNLQSNTFGKSKILKILCKELKYLLSLK